LRLEKIGVDPASIDAILITHEHSDHIAGLPVLARSLKKPVYLTTLTAPTIDWGEKAPPAIETFQAGASMTIGTIQVQSFTIPHDAVDPVGFAFECGGRRLAIATDLGYIPNSIRFYLQDCDAILLESNHDLEMLKVGPYPWSLKQRVMGRKGHLSNDHAAQFILDDLGPRTHTLLLGHLSEQNNYPELAHLSASNALQRRGLTPSLVVAEPRQPCASVEL
jgi:phosphoribosyl 1,2-cyclic phosphodiesterase